MKRIAWLVLRGAILAAFLCLPAQAGAAAFDANGVALGETEAAVLKAYPGIRCKPLEWKSDAAERRCDDAKVAFAGIQARVTFYLKADAVQGFDLRFEGGQFEPVADFLRNRYGKPDAETREKIVRKGKEQREVHKIAWKQGRDKALLFSPSNGKRVTLSVSRGDFADEIYRVK